MSLDALKQQYVHAIYQQKAFIISPDYINLHHGGKSHLYLNHREFLSKYKYLELIIRIYIDLIPKNLKDFKLGTVDSVMSPVLAGMLAAKMKKDTVVVKEQKLTHGTEEQIYGDCSGEIVLIDDVTSTGSILINAARILRKKGASVRHVFISACRDMSAVENLKKENITAHYIATYEEIIRIIWPRLSKDEKKTVKSEIKERDYPWKLP